MNRLEMKSLSGLLTAFKECLQAASEHEANVMKLAALGAKMPTVEQMAEMLAKAAEMGAFDEREPASDAVRTSAREFIAAVDEHCELEVGDKVEIIGPDFAGSTKSIGEHVKIQTPRDGDGDYLVDDTQWSSYPASSLRKITALAFKVGDRVKVVIDQPGLHWPASTLGFVATVGHDFTGHTYFVKMKDDGCGIWQGESSLEPAPAPLLPVGTLVANPLRRNEVVAVDHIEHNGEWFMTLKQPPHPIKQASCYPCTCYRSGELQPLIPALLCKGECSYPTTGEYKVQDGKLYIEVDKLPANARPSGTSRHYWPLAECKPLADDARWEVK